MYNLGFFLFFLEKLSSQYLGRKYVEMHVALALHLFCQKRIVLNKSIISSGCCSALPQVIYKYHPNI